MKEADRLALQIEPLCSRLGGLNRASRRLTKDLDAALQEIAEKARSLTGARYSVITTGDECGDAEGVTASDLEHRGRCASVGDSVRAAPLRVPQRRAAASPSSTYREAGARSTKASRLFRAD